MLAQVAKCRAAASAGAESASPAVATVPTTATVIERCTVCLPEVSRVVRVVRVQDIGRGGPGNRDSPTTEGAGRERGRTGDPAFCPAPCFGPVGGGTVPLSALATDPRRISGAAGFRLPGTFRRLCGDPELVA